METHRDQSKSVKLQQKHRSPLPPLIAWWSIIALAVTGIVLTATGDVIGPELVVIAVICLGAKAVAQTYSDVPSRNRREVIALAALAMIPAVLALAIHTHIMLTPWPDGSIVLLIALSAQLLLLVIGKAPRKAAGHGGRLVFPFIGHTSVIVGSTALILNAGSITPGVALAYTFGFTMLTFHAYWSACNQDPTGTKREWELILLIGVLAAAVAAALHYLTLAGHLSPSHVPVVLTLAAIVVAAAILSGPPRAPRILRSTGDIATDVVAHGVAGIAFVNVLFLAYALVATWSIKVILAVLLLWTLTVVYLEYRSVMHLRHCLRSGKLRLRPTGPPEPKEPLTVIVPAADEAEVLPESMQKNLQIDHPLRFIIVPATKSSDDTVAIAESIALAHPERVRVLMGDTGSKAEDLNKAWLEVDTPNVLILDADETIDGDSLARGLWVLKQQPEVGIVQGRKVSSDPESDPVNRFACCERRYSTGVDTLLHAQKLGSSHFGGSGALLRREVPDDVGGWTTFSMVEDIDFTLRIHLDSQWRIHYEPTMIVEEAPLSNMRELFRQRTRWGRGWIQCVTAYFPQIWRRRKHLGGKRTVGLSWLLLTCVSSLWLTLLPAALLLRVSGLQLVLPLQIALVMTILLLPARFVSYGYSALNDPVIPIKRGAKRFLEHVFHAYSWILVGWCIQLHALYLEFSKAPRVWYVTRKRSRGGPPLSVPGGTTPIGGAPSPLRPGPSPAGLNALTLVPAPALADPNTQEPNRRGAPSSSRAPGKQ
jgi:cellulose synthase/poly-beta-1,6-N-acetylglucosamine synthase-like glycosyltransferase